MAGWPIRIVEMMRRHGDHHDGVPEEEETEEEIRAHLDSARNHAAAETFWYTILAILIIVLVIRLARTFTPLSRLFPASSHWSHWRLRLTPRWLPLYPLDKVTTILLYSLFITALITWKSIDHDDLYLERLGFRAAWVSTTQPTLVFLLAARTNPIGLVLGGSLSSYNQINWLHRWASRVFFATVTVHASFFLAEWLPAGFLWTELETVAMVKWGFAAWFVLLWMVVSSLVPFRRWRYEFFVLQHVLSAVGLLVLLVLHVPEHHHFSVWCAVVAFAYDVVTRSANPLWRNIRVRIPSAAAAFDKIPRYAFSARIEAIDEDLTAVTIRGVSFKWTPGQHILIWSPTFKWQSPHPFTISTVADPTTRDTQDVQLLVKTKRGFTQQLNDWATRRQEMGQDTLLRVLVAGPYGRVPDWRRCTNLVLVAGSTGGSFTTSVLEDIIRSKVVGSLQSVTSVYIVRRKAHASAYMAQLSRVLPLAKSLGLNVHVEVAITGGASTLENQGGISHETEYESKEDQHLMSDEQDGEQLQDLVRDSSDSDNSARSAMLLKEEMDAGLGDEDIPLYMTETYGRPSLDGLLRREIDRAAGLVGVAVCAGAGIEDAVRRAVVSASAGEARDVWLHVERAGA